ncbi:unnamed protein product [Prunus armeniaca]|uniref:RNase H type-1 domain-containing protein n=1 Tax=Prunus armeniaca TaxID=36596 RepID=A0A6J5W302_PRUAR|nr:unnamed protein product [Prunus armeniaca]
MLLWSLWNERNSVVWTATRQSSFEVVNGAVCLLHEFKDHQPSPMSMLSRAQAKWQKPLLGAIKINVDGAFNVQISTGGGGLIV